MEQEHFSYHQKADTCNENHRAVGKEKRTPVGKNYIPEDIHCTQIMTGVDLAIEG